jgi:O-antigen ligase
LTSAILVVGLLMAVGLAIAMVRPAWRLPVIAFALLAIPGNVDDLLPQLALDPHDIPDAVAPIITSIDLLIAWGLVLTLRERRDPGPLGRRIIALGAVLASVATLTVLVNLAGGLDPAAAVRGIVLWWRIVALLYLGCALRAELGNGRLLALGIVAGGVILLGNGVYTTFGGELDRFTAKTFGRNGLAVALTVVTVVGTAVAADLWSRANRPLDRWLAVAAAVVAGLSLFAMSATGTRMAFLVLVGAGIAALVLYPGRLTRRAIPGIALTLVAGVLILGASVLWTTAGGRTVSVITEPEDTVGAVTDPGSIPTETEIRSRGEFWDLAIQMARANPLTGVGPFQWNVVRYDLDPTGPVVVADSHDTYLQIAAEYGFVTLALYGALLLLAVVLIGRSLLRIADRERLGWAGMGIVIGSGVIPLAALTNAHVINPRNGPLEWLLLGAATGLCLAVREGAGVRAEDGEPATARSVPSMAG